MGSKKPFKLKTIHTIKVRMCSNDCCVREAADDESDSEILSESESEEAEEGEDEGEEDEGEEGEDDDEDDEIIRAKWMFDGCATLDAIIKRLQEHIVYIEELKSEGWQLTGPVEDDYGFMKKPKVEN